MIVNTRHEYYRMLSNTMMLQEDFSIEKRFQDKDAIEEVHLKRKHLKIKIFRFFVTH